jgi:hypothetical protein
MDERRGPLCTCRGQRGEYQHKHARQDADDQAYEERVSKAMKNYKPSIGGAAETGQTEPITIDIDIRSASLHLIEVMLISSDDSPPIPLVFNPGGMSTPPRKQRYKYSLTCR